jgi:DNA helicase IV
VVFVRTMLQHLVDLYANATGQSPDTVDRHDVESLLRDSRDVRRELNLAWPPLAAEQVLADLFASPERLFAATPGWTNDERVLLLRNRAAGWSAADIALLDEVAELVGEDDAEAVAESHREHQQAAEELRHAREVLASMGGQAAQLVSAEALAARFAEHGPQLTVAERAFSDRTWTYGHVIVDEAQELSPMVWRLLLRRCPTRSFTLVGDVAQATGAAVSGSWDDALTPHVGGAWRQVELTVNYRTPGQVMERACAMLSAAGYPTAPPTSVREGSPPRWVQVRTDADVRAVVADEKERLGDGRMAVIAPVGVASRLREVLALDDRRTQDVVEQVVLLTAEEAKGLEFDVVVVVDPSGIASEGPHGHRALFVALTRPTQRLVLAHHGSLPAGLTPPGPS